MTVVRKRKLNTKVNGCSPEEAEFRWLICDQCGGRWENCLLCPGLQPSPFICESCQGRDGVFKHHPYCPTQHLECPVDKNGEKECWWCKVHDTTSKN